MSVVRLTAAECCMECGCKTDHAHRTTKDCLRAIHAEMAAILARANALSTARAKLTKRRLEDTAARQLALRKRLKR